LRGGGEFIVHAFQFVRVMRRETCNDIVVDVDNDEALDDVVEYGDGVYHILFWQSKACSGSVIF